MFIDSFIEMARELAKNEPHSILHEASHASEPVRESSMLKIEQRPLEDCQLRVKTFGCDLEVVSKNSANKLGSSMIALSQNSKD